MAPAFKSSSVLAGLNVNKSWNGDDVDGQPRRACSAGFSRFESATERLSVMSSERALEKADRLSQSFLLKCMQKQTYFASFV